MLKLCMRKVLPIDVNGNRLQSQCHFMSMIWFRALRGYSFASASSTQVEPDQFAGLHALRTAFASRLWQCASTTMSASCGFRALQSCSPPTMGSDWRPQSRTARPSRHSTR
eukprot:6797370-Prymnesium_polylepis.2